jgi:hypothetical protein
VSNVGDIEMATHRVTHPVKGTALINLGRYKTFTVSFANEEGKAVPKVYPNERWDEVQASLQEDGCTIRQIAWVTPHILIQPNPDGTELGWRCGCEADFNGVSIVCCGDGRTPKEAQDAFWVNWNAERKANDEPTHLAILLRARYRVVLRG